MFGQLITLPARLSLRGVRLVTHVAEDLTGKAVANTLRAASVLENLRPGSGSGTPAPSSASPEPAQESNGGRPEAAPRRRPSPPREAKATPARPATPERDEAVQEAQSSDTDTTQTEVTEPGSTVTPPESEAAGIPTDPRREAPGAEPAPPVAPSVEPTEPLASERLEAEGETASIDLEATTSEPTHVSEEATLVREEAEPGAEDGAGASITVAEPWNGYAKMAAREVVARLSTASSAELAAIQLYESGNRSRRMVLQAVERELRTANRGQ
jgi:hypothetical protein